MNALTQDNPSLEKAFLPLIYLAWSDDLLSKNEVGTLHDFFSSSDVFSNDERQTLLAGIDVSNPPSRENVSEWKSILHTAALENPDAKSLFAFSKLLSGEDQRFEKLKPVFLELEEKLGLLSEEALSLFRTDPVSHTSGLRTEERFPALELTRLLQGDTAAIETRMLNLLQQPEFAYTNTLDIPAYREKVFEWCQIIAKEGFGATAFPEANGGLGDMKGYFAVMETLSYHDLSLVIKFGVQFGLWGMSVYFLGTKKHHDKYLSDIGSLKLPGCFAMTETGHGSNVKGLETTATYNHSSRSFIINTPNHRAQKEYIGNAAVHGQMATVFAQLIIDGKNFGVNTFIVPIRDAQGGVLTGVTIGDCGQKMGLNGVDNGTLHFNNVVIPMENML
ncbi:MAG: acyl-CoA oxidase, partial [Flavobacterium sp.]